MCPVYKNGKQHAFYICNTVLLLFLILNPCAASGPLAESARKWVIVLDPGHGGRDPGALGSFSQEKNINLAIALKTGEYLKKNLKNVQVVYTRDDDSTVDLLDRPQIANRNKADLFISIHANWARNKNVSGTESYIMGLAKDEDNLAVAMKENEVILLEDDYSTRYQGFDPKSPESYIIFTLMQNVFQKQSTDLAMKVQNQFRERANRNDRGVKQAGFWVLFNTTMPAVLIETGFITNAAEEKYLNSNEGQEHLASAIFRACRDYINSIDNMSNFSMAEKETKETQPPAPADSAAATPGDGIVFMVQVASASSRSEIKPDQFRGINDIVEIHSQERYKYATGSFAEYADAVKYRRQIEQIYPDAFVIALKDNKIIPLQQALDLKRKK
ncbi:MAG TPA: N-acetylmuramoyl-L-alanine amidase [Bacteroidales bacterium]|nr:N-acetylmuramoyl-L-alanine amidase [Bacteroidales bacterium]HQJ81867.1 N-acetylmuramoyl-L-alanine amidase [Bacteroidales bacterium]